MKSLISSIILMVCVCMAAAQTVKVACIGNSITYGMALPDPLTQSYPGQLQVMLDSADHGRYEVGNFGLSGATLMRHGHRPYDRTQQWADAKAFVPDIAVIHLGINDTDPRDWPDYNTDFARDYYALIDTLRMINPDVRVIMVNLSPIKATHRRYKAGTHEWRLKIRDAICRVAQYADVELIDFETPLRDRQNLLPDGLHPSVEGAGLLAQTVYGAITGAWGGLQLPEIYADGMVLPRDRYLPIRGRADTGAPITVTLAGRQGRTVADNRGDWVVTMPPLAVGGPYELEVTDGKDTIRVADILAGELWVASGQSNMEFRLGQTDEGEAAWRDVNDPQLRFFNMKVIAPTNSQAWPDSIIDQVNALGYYQRGAWEQATPQQARQWSAVAYHFAKQLRDSLDVPIGIISNAVGGAPIESWTDITALEAEIPDLLVDWSSNPYVQPWVQGRGAQNVGDTKANRHPYEPGYLFAAGVRPLGQVPVSGVIWYQGESNAHNTELHERLFPVMVQSWREYFGDDSLPWVFAQLSSLNRPSWPEFRDSQRRLSQRVPHTAMVVTSDYGDSLDVHPTRKRPVGERMAAQALRNVYGHDLVAQGPTVQSVRAENGKLVLGFGDCASLGTSDGQPVCTFEVAEIEGFYAPATVEINGTEIILSNETMKQPKYARYGWQPFTRANLINEAGLPSSTFKVAADNMADLETEAGIDAGVSACYAGMLDGQLLMAGGCNFPERPLASDSQKRYYQGIYQADSATMAWRRIGSLPEPMAYGVTAPVDGKLALIGGQTPQASLSAAWLMSADGSLDALPSLPVAIDNAAAAAIGRRIYVAGGNADGQPSRVLWMLDLDNLTAGWKRLKDMPGNLRVQPAMAAGRNADGEVCLYVWGGFAGRGQNREPSLNTDGLCYSPAKNKWTALSAPVAEGEEISLGGGVAVTLTDGRIAACGGVNKDIFIEALRNQAPDYLSHDIEWYRFNPYLLIFDPQSLTWTVAGKSADTARAGAAAIAGSDGDLYLIGGELKPRIRTNQTVHIEI